MSRFFSIPSSLSFSASFIYYRFFDTPFILINMRLTILHNLLHNLITVLDKLVSHIATVFQSKRSWIRSRRRWTHFGSQLATFTAGVWIVFTIFRIAGFSANRCKTFHRSTIFITTFGSIRFGGSTWTWLFENSFASHLWQISSVTYIY